jgi:DNA-binding transcriptional ArsR family regulator
MHALDRTLNALADPTRRRIVDLLRREPRRASDLADAVGASRPATSRHLRVLRDSGLVDSADDETDDARERTYTLRKEPFDRLRGWLDEVDAFWTGQLASFADHVARTRAKR